MIQCKTALHTNQDHSMPSVGISNDLRMLHCGKCKGYRLSREGGEGMPRRGLRFAVGWSERSSLGRRPRGWGAHLVLQYPGKSMPRRGNGRAKCLRLACPGTARKPAVERAYAGRCEARTCGPQL